MSSRTVVLHVVDALGAGGAERMAVEVANLLDPDEFDVSMCATRQGGPLADSLAGQVPLTVLGRTRRWDGRGLVALDRLLRSRQVDIVHTHGRGSAKLVALVRRSGRHRFRHVFHDHFGGAPVENSVDRGLRLACRWGGVDAYLGVHHRLSERAVEVLGLPATNVHLLRNGVDLRRFQAKERPQGDGAVRLVAVAGFRPEKDHGTLLRAVARCESRDRVEVALVGAESPGHAAYAASCRALIRELGLDGQVSVQTADDVPAVLAKADVGVLSSRTESGPLAVLEYMAAGLPVVMTDTGEVSPAVRESGAGWVVPVGDPAAFATAIDRVVAAGDDGRRAMGALGRALVERDFDQRHVVERVAEVYRALLSEATARC
jgi:glycosyltransferase involved in cell wall biosynthesis